MTGSASLAKLLFVLISGVAHGGPAHQVSFGARPPATQAAIRRTFRARPIGDWSAAGRVVSARNVEGRRRGEALLRRWGFETSCEDGHCQEMLSRTISGDRVANSILTPHAGYYTADFPYIGTTCEVPAGESFTAHFRIWWSRQRRTLIAVETGGAPRTKGCPASEEKIVWTAKRHYGSPSEGTHEVL